MSPEGWRKADNCPSGSGAEGNVEGTPELDLWYLSQPRAGGGGFGLEKEGAGIQREDARRGAQVPGGCGVRAQSRGSCRDGSKSGRALFKLLSNSGNDIQFWFVQNENILIPICGGSALLTYMLYIFGFLSSRDLTSIFEVSQLFPC